MFEKEIEFIYKYNLNKIKDLGAFITYEQLIPANVHPALLQYLSAEIDFLIFEDRQKLLKDSLFDYSGEKIIEHFLAIGEEIKKTKKFSIDFLSKLILHASSFNVNFIIRPKWSLLQFVFENENETSKSVAEIKQILNYLYYYPYLKRLLINFFDKKRIITITYSEFKELLDKIDTINYETNFEKILENAFSNMLEFIYTGESHNKKISRQYVELFLADKGLHQFKVALTEKFGVNISERFEVSELKNAILEFKDILDTTDEGEADETDVYHESEEENSENAQTIEEENKEIESVVTENEEADFIPYSPDNEEETTAERNEDKKSFLEEHLEKLDKEVPEMTMPQAELDEESDLEPLDFDEAPRVDEKNVDDVYELANEEETIDSIVEEEEADLPRIEITDEDDEPFKNDILDKEEEVDETFEEINLSDVNETEEIFIEEGTKVSFAPEELGVSENVVETESPDEWPSETSENDDIKINLQVQEEVGLSDDSDDNAVAEELPDNDAGEENFSAFEDFEEPELFDKEEEENIEHENLSETVTIKEKSENSQIDISGLLEDKRIPKIIEVLFDYDMEEFANAIDDISECNGKEEALTVIDNIAERGFIDKSAKEIKLFKNIISDFFN